MLQQMAREAHHLPQEKPVFVPFRFRVETQVFLVSFKLLVKGFFTLAVRYVQSLQSFGA